MTLERAAEAAGERVAGSGERVRKALPTAPVPAACVVPAGYAIGEALGVARVDRAKGDDGKWQDVTHPVCPVPVVISRVSLDVETGARSLTVAWLDGVEWREAVAPRGVVASSRTIVGLADQGLPVTSSTAREVVDYLAALELCVVGSTERRYSRVSGRTGWHGRDYLRGRHAHGEACPIHETRDPLVADVVSAVGVTGELAEWRDMAREWVEYPALRLVLAASASAPLLHALELSPYVVDLAGGTSQGKTSAQRIAASVWGRPGYDGRPGLVRSWAATRVAVERLAHGLAGMPLILDDTMRARSPAECGAIVYDIASGQGRMRGAPIGSQVQTAGAVVLISSGEGPLSEMTGAGGLRGRVLTSWGSPLGGVSDEAAARVNRWRDLVERCHGHAGALIVDRIRETPVADLRREYVEIRSRLSAVATGHPVGDRLAGYAAAAELGGRVMSRAVGLGVEEWITAELWTSILALAKSADRPAAALDHALAWAMSRDAQLVGSVNRDKATTPQPWIGRIRLEGRRVTRLAFRPASLTDELRAAGYDPSAIVAAWVDRGWCERDRPVNVEGRTIRMVYLLDAALDRLRVESREDEGLPL